MSLDDKITISRRVNNSRDFYSRRFLFRDILNAAARCSHSEFAKFHLEAMRGHVPGFHISALVAGVNRFRSGNQFDSYDFYAKHNIGTGVQSLYSKHWRYDLVREIGLRFPGHAVFNSAIMPLDKWLDTEIYHYIKAPLGVHQSINLFYDLPFRKQSSLRFCYYSNFSRTFDPAITSAEIEFFTLPLFLAWLYRLDIVDMQTLEFWFELLVGMTPARLRLLREMVTIGRYQNVAIANNLNLSEGVVRNYILQASDAVAHLLPEPEVEGANLSQGIDLVRLYEFLRLAGRPLQAPQRDAQADQKTSQARQLKDLLERL